MASGYAHGAHNAQARTEGTDVTRLRGIFGGPNSVGAAVLATIPASCRPASTRYFAVRSGAAVILGQVDSDGSFRLQTGTVNASAIYLDAITFPRPD